MEEWALDREQWSASRFSRFTPGRKVIIDKKFPFLTYPNQFSVKKNTKTNEQTKISTYCTTVCPQRFSLLKVVT
jgi:hypothetical protein